MAKKRNNNVDPIPALKDRLKSIDKNLKKACELISQLHEAIDLAEIDQKIKKL